MTPFGQAPIDAAKADGRWAAAYASSRNTTVPADLLAAIEAEPKALVTYRQLNRQNIFALVYRLERIKTLAMRAKRIAEFVAMLKQGDSIYPNGTRAEVVKGTPRKPSAKSAKKVVRKRPKKKL
jgi:uncharacterized protein YdeI (YjbR/CyaY-like superfamily)